PSTRAPPPFPTRRSSDLAARAAELLALWDEKTEPPGGGATERIEQRAAARRRMWRDLLLFGEHTWGSPASGSDPDGADTVAQWQDRKSTRLNSSHRTISY